MHSPLISVIIPAYNSERFIGDTLMSVRAQTYSNLEVLIIDDGSTDSQKKIILKICDEDQRFKYYHQSNSGVSTARNRGIHLSKGEFIAFLDSDDIWLPDNLKLKLGKIQSNDFQMVHSDAVVIDEDTSETGAILQGREGWVLDHMLAWKETIVPGPSSVLVRKTAIDQAGMFDPQLSTSADQDFFFRIAKIGRIGRVDKITWQYRIHESNMHRNIETMEKDVIYVYKKAYKNGFFSSRSFANRCFANMYLILAASWAGDGKHFGRAVLLVAKAMSYNPLIIFTLLKRIIKKWAI